MGLVKKCRHSPWTDRIRETIFNYPWRNPNDRGPVPVPRDNAPNYHWEMYHAEQDIDLEMRIDYYGGFDLPENWQLAWRRAGFE
jgi:hypothetical protein